MYLVSLAMLVLAIFASYKLAQEKGQNHIVWPLVTAIFGAVVFLIQYLVSVYYKKTA